jgi:DNA repair protein SbcC/Rad50
MDGGERQLAETVTDVAREVRRIIGMGPADFRNTIYAGQKDLLSLLDRRPGERREWFMKILGIDYLKKESLGELKRLLDANDGELKRTTGKWEEIDGPALERRLVDQGNELEAREQERQKREEECTAARDRVRDLTEMLEALHADEKVWIRLTEQQRSLDSEIQRAEQECLRLGGEIESRNVLLPEFDGLEAQEKHYIPIKEQFQVLAGKKRQLEQIEAEKHYLALQQRQCAERIAQSDELLRHLEHDRETCRRLEPEIARRNAVKEELNRQKPQEKAYHELCGSQDRLRERFRGLEQRLHDIGREIRGLEEKSRDLEGSELIIAGYEAACQQEKAFAEAQVHARRCEGWREKIRDEEGDLIHLKERMDLITHALTGIDTISSQISEAEEQYNRLSGAISSAETRLGSLEEELQSLDTHINGLRDVGSESPCPTCHRPLHDHFEALMDELHAGRSAAEQAVSDQKRMIDTLRTEKAGADTRLKHLNRERDSMRMLAEERAVLQSEFRTRNGQLENWQTEIEREDEAVRSLGISGYDPDRHQAVIQKRRALEEIAKRIDGLEIECSRLPALQEEWHRLSD